MRATAPVRGDKSLSTTLCNNSNTVCDTSTTDSRTTLAHLDLQDTEDKAAKSGRNVSSISKSAEDLLEDMTDSLGEPKKRKNSGKKNKNGSGFFRRLFGLSRKSSTDAVDEEAEGDDIGKSTTSVQFSSIQENAEFFKPLKVDTNLSADNMFNSQCSEATGQNLVLDNKSEKPERKITPKELKLIIPNTNSSQTKNQQEQESKNGKSENVTLKSAVDKNSPIEPYGTSKDLQSDTKRSFPPPIPTTLPRTASLTSKSPKHIATTSSNNKALRSAKSVSISESPQHRITSCNPPEISPVPVESSSKISGSVSETSLLSNGSSDCRSMSSREEQGSSGNSRELGRDGKLRKSRPKSQSGTASNST